MAETFTDKALDKANWLAEENDLTLLVDQFTLESSGVVSLRLRGLKHEQLPAWQPGAHIDVHLSSSLVRQFSLCSNPEDLSHYRVAVRLEDVSSGGSTYVHQRLRVGQTVRVVGPRNRFTMQRAQTYAFIAGGIGITPILPMVRACETQGYDWRLYYAGRDRASMPFLDELSNYGEKVQVYSSKDDGRVDLGSVVPALPEETHIYACGPVGLLDELETICPPTNHLHFERFKAKPRDTSDDDNAAIEVTCVKSGLTLEVAADVPILDTLENAGLDVPSSCREGICGTCEQTILEGIPEHRDEVLSESEREAGETMMICVSRAQTPTLALDV